MNIFRFLFGYKCRFVKPIVSQYQSFKKRKIVFECKCGKRKAFDVIRDFSEASPIQTSILISNEEFQKHLNKDLNEKDEDSTPNNV